MAEFASHHVLAIDVGNSRIKYGLFTVSEMEQNGQTTRQLPRMLHHGQCDINDPFPWEQLIDWSRLAQDGVVISGSNPKAIRPLLDTWPKQAVPEPEIITEKSSLPITVDVDFPEQVGIDRLLNAVAVNAIRPEDHPVLIVDSGTATTIDAVCSEGRFVGGAIMPGFDLTAKALHEYTALLPRISMDQLDDFIHVPVGRNTIDAVCSGLYFGHLGAIRELCDQMTRQLFRLTLPGDVHSPVAGSTPSSGAHPVYYLTGGGAAVIHQDLNEYDWEPHLALQGLVLTYLNVIVGPDMKPESSTR